MAIAIHAEHPNIDSDTLCPLEEWAELRQLELVKAPGTSSAEEMLGTIAAYAFESKDVTKLLRQMRWNMKTNETRIRIRLEGDESSQVAFRVATARLQRLGYI